MPVIASGHLVRVGANVPIIVQGLVGNIRALDVILGGQAGGRNGARRIRSGGGFVCRR
jgi:hypothetical protein